MAPKRRSHDETLMATLPRARRKALGQFATPDEIAAVMAAWIDRGGVREFVDPAVGTGALLRAVVARHGGHLTGRLIGGEIDPAAAAIAQAELTPLADDVLIRIGDFFDAPVEGWSAISCNPPYLNAASLPDAERARIRAIVERDSAIAFRGGPNLALLFSARLLAFLAPGGRMALLIPSELLEQRTAAPFKRALLERDLLRGVIVFDEAESPFDGVETTATVLLLERPLDPDAPVVDREIGISHVGDAGSLPAVEAVAADRWERRIAASLLLAHAAGRWTQIFADRHDERPGEDDALLGEIAMLTSPQNTGFDAFFIRSAKEWRSLGIAKRHLMPVIAWKGMMPENGRLDAEWLKAQDREGARVWLLVLPRELPDDEAVRALIEARERDGLPKGLRGKSAWWSLRRPDPAPIYAVSYWHPSSHFAILRNEARVAGFASFFSVRPSDPAETARIAEDPAIVAAFIGAKRNLGHGLSKIEVSDARRAIVRGWRRSVSRAA